VVPPSSYFRLCRIIKAHIADFEPEGMDAWEAEQSEENISAADRKVKERRRHMSDPSTMTMKTKSDLSNIRQIQPGYRADIFHLQLSAPRARQSKCYVFVTNCFDSVTLTRVVSRPGSTTGRKGSRLILDSGGLIAKPPLSRTKRT
jgi:hypothetical protein